jgi:CubicO group peptidase (beta-lactamase class C family)
MSVLEEAGPRDAGFIPERIALLNTRLESWIEQGLSQATSVLVARHGKVVYHKAHGRLTPEADSRLLETGDVFPLASIQKVMTATAVMMCVERGEINLNAPITDYLPEVPAEWGNAILVHNLLTHTSGYYEPDMQATRAAVLGEVAVPPCPEGQDETLHRALSVWTQSKPLKKPSEQNIYSNLNFCFLAEILRRVLGQRIDTFMHERILGPLGMSSSYIPVGAAPESKRVHLTFAVLADPVRRKLMLETATGAVGLASNAWDLGCFCQMFLNGGSYGDVKLLAPSTVAEMTRNQIPGIPARSVDGLWIKEASWGLGWMLQGDARWRYGHGSLQPVGSYYHQGGSGTAIWVDPLHEIVGVFLSTARDFQSGEISWDFDLFQNLVMSALDD